MRQLIRSRGFEYGSSLPVKRSYGAKKEPRPIYLIELCFEFEQ